VKQTLITRIAVSHKCNVIIGSYVPERPNNYKNILLRVFYFIFILLGRIPRLLVSQLYEPIHEYFDGS
jgi:hypothetical protein